MQGQAVFNVDIGAIQDLAMLGVRRAAAFLGLGFYRPDQPLPTSLLLDPNFGMRWFPEPLSAELAGEIVQNYNAWLVAGAFKELDQSHSLFLDEVWSVLRISDFIGGPLPEDFVPDRQFHNDTNVASKLRKVGGRMGLDFPHLAQFEAFSLARNALTHNQGIVRERDRNEGEQLILRWKALQVVIQGPDGDIVLEPGGDVQFPLPPMRAEAPVVLRMVERQREFRIGASLVLNPFELSGIIYSYQISVDTVVAPFTEFLQRLIAANPVPPAEDA